VQQATGWPAAAPDYNRRKCGYEKERGEEEGSLVLLCKRILRVLVLLVSTSVLLLSLVGGIGIWVIRDPIVVRATQIFGRVEAALDVVDEGLEGARKSLGRAMERLESARQEQRNLSQQPQPKNGKRKALALAVKRGLAQQVEDSRRKLSTVAEASVVVNSVLQDVGNLPFLSASGLDHERLTELNRSLAKVGPAAWELSEALGDPDSDANAAGEQFSHIDKTMQTIRGSLDEYQPKVQQVRERTKRLKDGTQSWMTTAAVLISGLCFWIALSQACLLRRVWSWGKVRRPSS
jgi:hypothetical protein